MKKEAIVRLLESLMGEHRLTCSYGDDIDKCPTYPAVEEAVVAIRMSDISA